ncbi:hypothetical protein Ssi03_12890 [Sphaerisporangium siamense]|uniref:Uncharacterized protein n=1 Tax=Sphaerisporangium siamense TaxID=795645 RepID=A0A7W7D9W3_9ACTN|nr:hypothetical protein [Sphaerisporangium siamense]MBB4702942.1 hypothetical protein [Sphaerisporangium siamense]GII83299.1 hypothetical protein Ssi03_12890 [Sphaerisporangium siamense]
MSFGHITVVPETTCDVAGAYAIASTRYWTFAGVESRHNVEILIDGYTAATLGVWPQGDDSFPESWVHIPNDGRSHEVQYVDRGLLGTPEGSTVPVELASNCPGVLKARVLGQTQNSQSRETFVDVEITRGNTASSPYTCRLVVDGKPAGADIVVNSGETLTRRITIPGDGSKHLIKAELWAGYWASEVPFLWYVVQAMSPGGGGGIPPTGPASQFVPGETVYVQSNTLSTPLATDGSEWVLVEISPRGTTDQWEPAGVEGGLISPDDDGAWYVSIETNAQDFPVGSQWAIRVRRFRNYQESLAKLAYFDMVAGPVPPVPGTYEPPVITGPVNHNQPGSSWMDLWGTGWPGSVMHFDVEHVTEWGTTYYLPLAVSTGPTGQWHTRVYDKQQDPEHDYKVISYRARSSLNGQTSEWSEPREVTWHRPLR